MLVATEFKDERNDAVSVATTLRVERRDVVLPLNAFVELPTAVSIVCKSD